MLPNSCLWCLWNVHLALVLGTSYVLISSDIANKDFSCKIRPFLYREHFWNAFPAKETPCCTPVFREEEEWHFCFCHNVRRSRCDKEARGHTWAQRHWGWCLYKEVNVESHHVACNMLFSGVFLMAILACFYELTLAVFPSCAHRAWSCTFCSLQKGKHFWSAFQAMEGTCTKPGFQGKRGLFGFWALCIGEV